VKRQVENVLIVIAKETGKMEYGNRIQAQFNGLPVENVVLDLVKNHIKNTAYYRIANYALN
jgi:hypothetical protein